MVRTRTRLAAAGALLAVTLGACGGRVSPPVAVTNETILTSLSALGVGEAVEAETYGYEVDGESRDDFFAEVRYRRRPAAGAGEIVRAVREHLGAGWEVTDVDGAGCCVAATFASGPARVGVTTWDDGFDVTVAAEGASLDDTHLAF